MFKNFSCVNCAKDEEEPESHPLDQSTGAVGQEEIDDLYADLEGPDDQMLKEQEKNTGSRANRCRRRRGGRRNPTDRGSGYGRPGSF
mmetsp:Transcript_42901/g.70324  ORF Transcript_42901/g.70324 Transcript_42901/m.70324 type:complete len:87 (-) Transcript_42901:562-822(-)